MPQSVSRVYDWANTSIHYITHGPLPAPSVITQLILQSSSSGSARFRVSPVLSLSDAADSVSHARGQRIIDRSSVMLNEQPALQFYQSANSWLTTILTPHLRISSSGVYIHYYLAANALTTNYALLATSIIFSNSEYQASFGDQRRVSIISAKVPSSAIPTSPAPA